MTKNWEFSLFSTHIEHDMDVMPKVVLNVSYSSSSASQRLCFTRFLPCRPKPKSSLANKNESNSKGALEAEKPLLDCPLLD